MVHGVSQRPHPHGRIRRFFAIFRHTDAIFMVGHRPDHTTMRRRISWILPAWNSTSRCPGMGGADLSTTRNAGTVWRPATGAAKLVRCLGIRDIGQGFLVLPPYRHPCGGFGPRIVVIGHRAGKPGLHQEGPCFPGTATASRMAPRHSSSVARRRSSSNRSKAPSPPSRRGCCKASRYANLSTGRTETGG